MLNRPLISIPKRTFQPRPEHMAICVEAVRARMENAGHWVEGAGNRKERVR
jgi:hypothetical protein